MQVPTIASLEQRLDALVEEEQLFGCAVVLVDTDGVQYARGFGHTTSDDGGMPITPDTIFPYASISKALAALLVMRLVDQGMLDLDQPLVQMIPGYAFADTVLGAQVTLRHVLSHTTGIAPAGKDAGPSDADALERYIWDELSTHAFLHAPDRNVHQYNSTAYCIAGYAAEVVTGQYFDDLMQTLIFDPLGMTRTTYRLDRAITYPVAISQDKTDAGFAPDHFFANNRSGHPSSFCLGSARDLAKAAQMILAQGRVGDTQLLDPALIEAMQTQQTDGGFAATNHPFGEVIGGFGLGLQTGRFRGHKMVRHGGVQQNYNQFFDLFPEAGKGLILLTNYSDWPAFQPILFALYDHLLGLPELTSDERLVNRPVVPTTPQPDMLGRYVNVEQGRRIRVENDADGMALCEGDGCWPLQQVGPSQYFFQQHELYRSAVTFHPDAAQPIVMLTGDPFIPSPYPTEFQAEPTTWNALVGDYLDYPDPDGRNALRIFMQEDALHVRWDDGEGPCEPVAPATFLTEIGELRFEQNDTGGISGVRLGRATFFRRIN